ncbi:MAG: hypothetical protein IKH34_03050 [Oscillospiraceae bacterium]|nr:hypothetical protein [Oscillospiraceae bacterium]
MKRHIAWLLLLCLVLGLCACGSGDGNAEGIISGEDSEATDGWIPSRIAFPDWLARSTGWETLGDTIWLSGLTPENALVAASYDTLSGQWRRIDFTTGDAYHPQLGNLSAAGNSLWGLLQEGPSWEDLNQGRFRDDYGYYVLHIDLGSGASTAVRIPFEGEGSTEGSGLHFSGILGLDDDRALLGAMDRFYVIDANAAILSEPSLPTNGSLWHFRVGDTLYLWTQEGYAPFDPKALRFGEPLDIDGLGEASSNSGHFLRKWQRSLCAADPATGESELLFRWMDVALSFGDTQGGICLENSLGDVYYPDGEDTMLFKGLICAKRGQVPVKQTLRLGCFGESGGELYAQAQANGALPYSATTELLDAIVRFNNTDPEYRIEVVPITYANEQERDRVLIELATRTDLDLLDTSMLPDNALDSGLLADMLPMIDADESISREDFIEPLLALMTQSGGLYEYTDKFTLLTITTHPDLFPGRENWTAANIEALIAAHPEMDPLWHSYDRELVTTLFCWAASAEFIDRATASCSFDGPAFVHWLELLKALPDGGQYSEEPKLMNICYDLAFNAGHQEKYMMKGEYVVAGFPETQGTGSYYLKLGSSPNPWRGTIGENTRIGILAASGRQEGAWRFVRTLMEGSDDFTLSRGIPVFKAAFERALEAEISDDFDERFQIGYLSAENAEELRRQVYGTTKLVVPDEALIRLMREEIKRYHDGQLSAAEAAAAIQSRAKIYVSEQYG